MILAMVLAATLTANVQPKPPDVYLSALSSYDEGDVHAACAKLASLSRQETTRTPRRS
ncbi:MAG: hypothetical protein ACRD1V_06580 [Vicinamibacterales bacterium]